MKTTARNTAHGSAVTVAHTAPVCAEGDAGFAGLIVQEAELDQVGRLALAVALVAHSRKSPGEVAPRLRQLVVEGYLTPA